MNNSDNLPIYKDQTRSIEERVQDLYDRLTFEEKCLISAGENNNAPPAIPRLGIPRFGMTDGPHGVSPYKAGIGPDGYHEVKEEGGAATYFPTGIQMASTWDPELIEKFGAALAEETRAVGRYMQLGPAMNICRNPMNGRTFEYYSEDPLLSGEMGAAAVKGLQSKRIAPCVKHFVANNQETNRFKVNVVVSRRALEEIYLAGFKRVVQKSDPWGIMSSYNKVNGVYVSENKLLLREILKEQWGFSGVVVSDWGATNHTTGLVSLIEAGLDIEMGSRNKYQIDEMKRLKDKGKFPEKYFEDNVKRILRTMIRTGALDDPATLPEGRINTPDHQAISRKIAEEGMILLKNENNLLPLDRKKIKKIALLGKHADMKFGRKKLGGGSSAVYPPYEITIREGLKRKCGDEIEIIDDPAEADVAIVCIGLDHTHDFKGGDHEGSDSLHYSMKFIQPSLVKRTVKKNPNTIVVLVNGKPFGMERFYNKVPAILEAWYGGMEIGNVVADILFGDVNPSGKLPVSWPKYKKDIPTALTFLQTVLGVKEVVYEEDVFVGYRYYNTYNKDLRFCFGYGLSYTTFDYSDLRLDKKTYSPKDTIKATFTISNTGSRDGAEIAQLYIHEKNPPVPRPIQELRGFRRVNLKAGESKKVTIEVPVEELAYYDEQQSKWVVPEDSYEVWIGSSSRDIHLKVEFDVKST